MTSIKDKIEPQTKKITEHEIIELEKKLNIKLPQDYKNFLLEFNGGYAINNYELISTINDQEEGYCVVYFHQLSELEFYSLRKDPESTTNKYVIIANDYAHSFIFISLDIDIYGYVYGYADGEDTNLLAYSFTDFIDKIEKIPEDELT